MHRYHGNGGIISFLLLGGRWHSCQMLFDIEALKKANAGSIYLALVKCIKDIFSLAKMLYPSSPALQPLSTGLQYIISG